VINRQFGFYEFLPFFVFQITTDIQCYESRGLGFSFFSPFPSRLAPFLLKIRRVSFRISCDPRSEVPVSQTTPFGGIEGLFLAPIWWPPHDTLSFPCFLLVLRNPDGNKHVGSGPVHQRQVASFPLFFPPTPSVGPSNFFHVCLLGRLCPLSRFSRKFSCCFVSLCMLEQRFSPF